MTNTGWTRLPRKKVANPNYGGRLLPLKCTLCGRSMRIKRRDAHPELGPKFELQTFACRCGQIQERNAASPGAA